MLGYLRSTSKTLNSTIRRSLALHSPSSSFEVPHSPSTFKRSYSAAPSSSQAARAQRALLYIPGSNPQQLSKVLGGGLAGKDRNAIPDAVILDLEDSVRQEKKGEARRNVLDALQARTDTSSQRFVRINSRKLGLDDLEVLLTTLNLQGIVMPKVDSAQDVQIVDRFIEKYGLDETKRSVRIIASIESPLALLNLREIATSSPRITSLLFAAEDYCASSNLIRTPTRREMLFARSSVVTVAKAYGLKAVDLVCTQYKGEGALDSLREESREGRQLGFDGKQAIHPAQVEPIQAAFTPSDSEIERALAILANYESLASSSGAGAYGLANEDGTTSMIDAPMLLQAQGTISQARAAGTKV